MTSSAVTSWKSLTTTNISSFKTNLRPASISSSVTDNYSTCSNLNPTSQSFQSDQMKSLVVSSPNAESYPCNIFHGWSHLFATFQIQKKKFTSFSVPFTASICASCKLFQVIPNASLACANSLKIYSKCMSLRFASI